MDFLASSSKAEGTDLTPKESEKENDTLDLIVTSLLQISFILLTGRCESTGRCCRSKKKEGGLGEFHFDSMIVKS